MKNRKVVLFCLFIFLIVGLSAHCIASDETKIWTIHPRYHTALGENE